ncbi:MAG TPA: hypothetical protein VG758_19965 [Hyphomicrobiaceae bacterium]|nr:hypothetical protein [Hyphomicrobiaceae bacterium]
MGQLNSIRAAAMAGAIAAATCMAQAVGAEQVPKRAAALGSATVEAVDLARVRPGLSRLLGVWHGTYICAQGLTGLTLTISGSAAEAVEAEFQFYAVAQNSGVPSGRFRMSGVFDGAASVLVLEPREWLERPPGYLTVGMRTLVAFDLEQMTGTISGPGCGQVRLSRDQLSAVHPSLPRAGAT